MVLSGPPGTGKTHVAKIVARAFSQWAVDLHFHGGWKQLKGRIPRSTFLDWADLAGASRDELFVDKIDEALESDVVVLDDVGSESDRFKNGANADRLRRLLSKSDHKWVLITTNIPAGQWSDVFDARVADRLMGAKHYDTTGAQSWRSKRKEA